MSQRKYCRFYVVRHGQTEWNVKGVVQGQSNSPLTQAGIKQAKETGKKLKNIQFAAIFSSDLIRAERTAQIIAVDHQLAVKTNALLREKSFGKFEGIKILELKEKLQNLLNYRDQLSDEARFKYSIHKEIETDESMAARFLVFLRETAVAYPNKNVLVVSHGSIMRTLLVHLGWTSYAKVELVNINNAGYFVMESDGVDFYIKKTEGIDVGQPINLRI